MPTEQEQKSTILLVDCILHWVKTSLNTLSFGWPNLACHRLLDLAELTPTDYGLLADSEVVYNWDVFDMTGSVQLWILRSGKQYKPSALTMPQRRISLVAWDLTIE